MRLEIKCLINHTLNHRPKVKS